MIELSTLNIFNTVVESGSFSSASTKLFMSSPAVLHRMNGLEESLGVSVFVRNAQGITLTKPGEVLYSNSKKLLEQSEHIVNIVKKSAMETNLTIRIGSAIINPIGDLNGLWNRIAQRLPQYHLQFIPLENETFKFPDTYNNMGKKVDILFSPYGMNSVQDKINFIEVGRYNFTIMMHVNDPLANKKSIELADLEGASVNMMPIGMSKEIDHEIKRQDLKINLINTDAHYTINTFNRFTASGKYLLSLSCWNNVLPGLINKPLDVPFSLPYGFITTNKPDESLKLFIDILKSEIKK
ncbi:LysR family transcriptional regulator [Companilactobacillus kimchiensis]|uniref:LysR family transcriptional regulator n=1 Tax=Companilactobacillus kimchiensis TaxID=993692 RepID=A0A0R2LKA5_9LACO|nr:LysR family transcriptional regulator [Companilactobacillus kimchiensis]KRO00604.1 LysR family transcriptional regulator [Companilactobacillus kimchiensis]